MPQDNGRKGEDDDVAAPRGGASVGASAKAAAAKAAVGAAKALAAAKAPAGAKTAAVGAVGKSAVGKGSPERIGMDDHTAATP